MRTTRAGASRRRAGFLSEKRRAVVSVVAMMFLVLFGSLATAMAIATTGNIRTAAAQLHISGAMSAAQTGLEVARTRLQEAAARFVVTKSEVNEEFGEAIWSGDQGSSALGGVTVLPPVGYAETSTPAGIAEALRNRHEVDAGTVSGYGFIDRPTIISQPPREFRRSDYADTLWVETTGVAVEWAGSGVPARAFKITYAPLKNGTHIRAIVTGYDFTYTRNGTPVQRTVMQDYQIVKRINTAISSPTQIMIGKNVNVTGAIGARFEAVTNPNGHPVKFKSDFYGLNDQLDDLLDTFFANVKTHDVDGDGRLRVYHPKEKLGIPPDVQVWSSTGTDPVFSNDFDRDGAISDFDIFANFYDRNGDDKVYLSQHLRDGGPYALGSTEFPLGGSIDDKDLSILIDSLSPDRNRNGTYGFTDGSASVPPYNGYWDVTDGPMADRDTDGNNLDQWLGYRDGVIDPKDGYAKLRGRLLLRSRQEDWASKQAATWKDQLRGPVSVRDGQSPLTYGVDDKTLPDYDAETFEGGLDALQSAAGNHGTFAEQVAQQLGVGVGDLGTYSESKQPGPGVKRYLRVDPVDMFTGLPANAGTAYSEGMPFNAPFYSDIYFRPVYENMTFKDVVIPMGNNGLFRNCTFIGVTHVRTTTANGHAMWSAYGKLVTASGGGVQPAVIRNVYGDTAPEGDYPPTSILPESARLDFGTLTDKIVLMAGSVAPLDRADVTGAEYAAWANPEVVPLPLIIGQDRVVDTKPFSNNIRFHDCTFVGSVVGDTPAYYTQTRNKLQFSGATRFLEKHPDYPDDPEQNPDPADVKEIMKSSMMMPQYSVDIGTFNPPPTQRVELKGAIIAGVLDARGNTSVTGTLLLTFKPVLGTLPLADSMGLAVGNPADFNSTFGYFGPDDGDAESLDPLTLPIDGATGQRIVGWDTNGDGIADVPATAGATPPSGGVAVFFNGYGRVNITLDTSRTLPDGVLVPLSCIPVGGTYGEGRP